MRCKQQAKIDEAPNRIKRFQAVKQYMDAHKSYHLEFRCLSKSRLRISQDGLKFCEQEAKLTTKVEKYKADLDIMYEKLVACDEIKGMLDDWRSKYEGGDFSPAQCAQQDFI